MEGIQEKLDGLNERLENLNSALQVLPERVVLAVQSIPGTGSHQSVYQRVPPIYIKDVLSDEEEMTSRPPSANGKVLPLEVQVQRLTAQLTAAYNRIAALEEQLMARRSLNER